MMSSAKDSDLLSYASGRDAQVTYILSLGVSREQRRSGVGKMIYYCLINECGVYQFC